MGRFQLWKSFGDIFQDIFQLFFTTKKVDILLIINYTFKELLKQIWMHTKVQETEFFLFAKCDHSTRKHVSFSTGCNDLPTQINTKFL
jgi:hypothetical protein